MDQLGKRISEISPLSPLDIKSSLLAFLSIVPEYLVEGRSVDLGEFGSMNVTLKSSGVENEEDFTTDPFKGNRIHFRPSVKFSNLMKNVKYENEEE